MKKDFAYFIVLLLPMSARNEQDQRYSQASFDGLAQPETKEGIFSNHVQSDIFKAGAGQGSKGQLVLPRRYINFELDAGR